MSTRQKTPYAKLARDLVYRAAEPFSAGDTPAKQVYRAWKRLDPEKTVLWHSRIRNAYYGNAGERTYLWLFERAVEVGLERPERNKRSGAANDTDYIQRLRWMQRNAHGADAEALGEAIRTIQAYISGEAAEISE